MRHVSRYELSVQENPFICLKRENKVSCIEEPINLKFYKIWMEELKKLRI